MNRTEKWIVGIGTGSLAALGAGLAIHSGRKAASQQTGTPGVSAPPTLSPVVLRLFIGRVGVGGVVEAVVNVRNPNASRVSGTLSGSVGGLTLSSAPFAVNGGGQTDFTIHSTSPVPASWQGQTFSATVKAQVKGGVATSTSATLMIPGPNGLTICQALNQQRNFITTAIAKNQHIVATGSPNAALTAQQEIPYLQAEANRLLQQIAAAGC